jgi:hypothetical protein
MLMSEEVPKGTTVTERLINVIYWIFNITAGLFALASVMLLDSYFSNENSILLPAASIVISGFLFSLGWAIRYILSGHTSVWISFPESLKKKMMPMLFVWISWCAGVSLGQNAWMRIVDPINSFGIQEYKFEQARQAGYSDEEIINFLSLKAQKSLFRVGVLYPLFAFGLLVLSWRILAKDRQR